VLVLGDAFFGFLRRGAVEPWLPQSHQQNTVVTEAAAAATGRLAAGGLDVVYDGVLGPWFLDTFLAATGLATLDYVVLLPPVEQCVEGVRNRVGHGFADEPATRKMHAEFASSAIDARHVVVPIGTPADIAASIREKSAAGELRYP
jgi:hypothetical protein